MSVLTELEGKQMKTTHTKQEGCNGSAKSLTNPPQNNRHLTQTPTVHLKDAEEQEYPNPQSGGRQTKCLWRRTYRVMHRLLIIHTKSTAFLVEMDKILLSFTPSSLCAGGRKFLSWSKLSNENYNILSLPPRLLENTLTDWEEPPRACRDRKHHRPGA